MTTPHAASGAQTRAEIADYYRQTQWQYYGLWSGRGTLALHYGYWDHHVRSHAGALTRLNEVLAEAGDIQPGDRVLDAGSGWGGSSIWLARARGAHCTGVTLERHQARIAAMMARKRGVAAPIRFTRGDFEQLPFAEASFDVVWGVESACHAADKAAFLREAHRVLAPGGRIVVSDFFRKDNNLPPDAERKLQSWVSQWVVPDLARLDGFADDAAAAGFADVAACDITENIRPAARRLYRTGLWTAPLAGLFRLIGLHNDHQQANWRSSIRQYRALQADAWRYGIVSARRPA